MEILEVKTSYTGGGIFQYVVQVDGDRWAMFDDDDLGREFVPVVDREPSGDDWHSDFFDRYDAGYLVGEEATEFMRDVLEESTLTKLELKDRIGRLYEEAERWSIDESVPKALSPEDLWTLTDAVKTILMAHGLDPDSITRNNAEQIADCRMELQNVLDEVIADEVG